MIQGIKIIDFHAHFPNSGAWFPDYEVSPQKVHKNRDQYNKQSEIWRKAYNFPEQMIEISDDREASDAWYEDIVKKDIETVVFISGGGNERLSRIVSFHPDRFIGFAHHYPFSEHAAETLKHAVTELGLKGYKILATALDKPIGDKSLYELWEICKQYSIPVIIHFGIQGAAGGIAAGININPLTLHDVAKDFPEVSFVVSHLGAGYPTELLHLCWVCPNVYVDTAGSNQWVRWMACEMSLQSLFKKFYETIGPERILFATDSSWFPRIFAYTYLEDQHRIMRFLRFSEEDIEMILYKNAKRLLQIE